MFAGTLAGAGYTALRGAEVVNLERTVVVTGDDFTHQSCTDDAGVAKTCTDGLHSIAKYPGAELNAEYVRFEKCGQRGRLGKSRTIACGCLFGQNFKIARQY